VNVGYFQIFIGLAKVWYKLVASVVIA